MVGVAGVVEVAGVVDVAGAVGVMVVVDVDDRVGDIVMVAVGLSAWLPFTFREVTPWNTDHI